MPSVSSFVLAASVAVAALRTSLENEHVANACEDQGISLLQVEAKFAKDITTGEWLPKLPFVGRREQKNRAEVASAHDVGHEDVKSTHKHARAEPQADAGRRQRASKKRSEVKQDDGESKLVEAGSVAHVAAEMAVPPSPPPPA